MALFSKPKDVVTPQDQTPTSGKGEPTPKRNERVTSSVRPLVPNDRKEARRAARQQMSAQREKARAGFEKGDPRYLPERDKGEVRKYVRDYVDARLSVATLMIPAMVIVILMTFFDDTEVRLMANFALWAFIAVAVLDCVLLGFVLRRKVTQRFGPGHTKGNAWYAAMRAAQLPFMRLPKPQVKLFRFPE